MFSPSDRWHDDDTTNRCPRCTSRHAISLALIRTDVVRKGELVSLKTGNHMRCEKCFHEFASTDEGVFEYAHQPAYPSNVTVTNQAEVPTSTSPLPVTRLKPRERKASL